LDRLERAIAAEHALAKAVDDNGGGIFDSANRPKLHAAEQVWDQVTDDLRTLRDMAHACPDAALTQMAFCITTALGCDSRSTYDLHMRFGCQIVQQAHIEDAPQEVIQALQSGLILLEAIADLDRFEPAVTELSCSAHQEPSPSQNKTGGRKQEPWLNPHTTRPSI
jgi:hypothetical protein